MEYTFVKRIEMEMGNGLLMELDVTQELLESVRAAFGLDCLGDVAEDHMKQFLISSMRNALETHHGEE